MEPTGHLAAAYACLGNCSAKELVIEMVAEELKFGAWATDSKLGVSKECALGIAEEEVTRQAATLERPASLIGQRLSPEEQRLSGGDGKNLCCAAR